MIRALGFGLLAGGILLLILGINAYNSTSSDISRFFYGTSSDRSIWLLAGGMALSVLGIMGALQKPKKAW
jgi:uncharacterized membrane protein YidH (DUF202 family)